MYIHMKTDARGGKHSCVWHRC